VRFLDDSEVVPLLQPILTTTPRDRSLKNIFCKDVLEKSKEYKKT
jgi:hypothetical protein